MIDICIITEERFFTSTRLCIEHLVSKTGMDIHLSLFEICSKTSGSLISDYWYELGGDKQPSHFKSTAFDQNCKSVAECRLRFINKAQDRKGVKYLCFFPINHIVNDNWAEDLVHNYTIFDKAGLIAIRTGSERLELTSLLCNDESASEQTMKPVWMSGSGFVDGLTFVSLENAPKLGMANFSRDYGITGYEDYEASFYAKREGLNNFYIVGSTCFLVKLEKYPVLFGEYSPENNEQFRHYIENTIKLSMETIYVSTPVDKII